jgi:hypothetical protein
MQARAIPILAVASVLAIAGCGSGGSVSTTGARAAASAGAAPAQTAATAVPKESLRTGVAVIRGWADALRRGDVDAAAAYFALPSLFANGESSHGEIPVATIRDVAQARAANETLSCGARLVSAAVHGRYIEAEFVLTGRPGPGGTNCGSGAGTTAATDFVIEHGKIVAWIRAPEAASSPGAATTTTPALSVPAPTPSFTPQTTIVT